MPMPIRLPMTKVSSNRSLFCDPIGASTITEDDDVATHWVLEHSEGGVFSVVVQFEEPVNTRNLWLQGHWC